MTIMITMDTIMMGTTTITDRRNLFLVQPPELRSTAGPVVLF